MIQLTSKTTRSIFTYLHNTNINTFSNNTSKQKKIAKSSTNKNNSIISKLMFSIDRTIQTLPTLSNIGYRRHRNKHQLIIILGTRSPLHTNQQTISHNTTIKNYGKQINTTNTNRHKTKQAHFIDPYLESIHLDIGFHDTGQQNIIIAPNWLNSRLQYPRKSKIL